MRIRIFLICAVLFFAIEELCAKNITGVSMVFDKRFSDIKEDLKVMFTNYGLNKVYKNCDEHFDLLTSDNVESLLNVDGYKLHSRVMSFEWCNPNSRIDELITKNSGKKIVLFIDNLKLSKFNNLMQGWKTKNVEVIGIDRFPSTPNYFYNQFKAYSKLSKSQSVQMIFWFPEDIEIRWEIMHEEKKEEDFIEGENVRLRLTVPIIYSDFKVSGTSKISRDQQRKIGFEKIVEDGRAVFISDYKVKEGLQELCVSIEGCKQNYCETLTGAPCDKERVEWIPNYKKKNGRGPFTESIDEDTIEFGDNVLLQRNLIYQFVVKKQCAFDSYVLHFLPLFSKDKSNILPDISRKWQQVDLQKSFDKVDEGYDLYKIDKDVFEKTVFGYYNKDVILFYIEPKGQSDFKSKEFRISLERCGGN